VVKKNNKQHTQHKDIIYGINTISVLLDIEPNRVLEIFYEQRDIDNNAINPRIKNIYNNANIHQISIQRVKPGTLDKWFDQEIINHQGIVAYVRPKAFLVEHDLIELIKITQRPVFLVLDNVLDPRNLGACIRSAAGFNVTAVIISRNAGCDITPTVKKTASGGVELVPIAKVGNLAACLKLLQHHGVWVVTLDASSKQLLSSIDLTIPVALVLGAEDCGVRRIIKEKSDFIARIPMLNNNMESLNLSVAAGICLYELTRQRLIN